MKEKCDILAVSYIGDPKPDTAMFVTKKVAYLLDNLKNVSGCLVFAENGMEIDATLRQKNQFSFSDSPQRAYADFVNALYYKKCEKERKRKYTLDQKGYYIGENVQIGFNTYIEPQCIIGHDVIIGRDANILYGSVIKNSIIGDGFLSNEYAVIGSLGFTITKDEQHNNLRIPTLGKVRIGNYVEIGAHDNISCGTGGDTVIEDYVKLDALVHIGHDAHLEKNVEVTAGSIVGGFAELGNNAYMGINSTVRNRVKLGENSVVGMGANVVKDVSSGITVAGNPARLLAKE